MSNLVEHAKTELARLGNGPEYDDHILRIVQTFADMGHSGASAAYTSDLIHALLQFKNLTLLTDDPDEWFFHGPDTSGTPEGFWQNKRNGEAFSHDAGKHYYLLSEGGNDRNREPLHASVPA